MTVATFTMTLAEILENNPAEDFGLGNYPIFDEKYRGGLNQKIVDRYLNREMGASTVQEFRLWMRRTMNEIMPAYNQLYLSERLKIDPLNTVDMSVINDTTGKSDSTGNMDGSSQSTGNSSQETTADASSRTVDMATPQNELSGTGDYATGAQDSISGTTTGSDATNTEKSSNTVDSTNKSESVTHADTRTKGFTGSQAVLLNEYRKTFLNIDLQIIEDLSPLFMQIWTSGDSLTQGERHGYWPYFGFYY